MTKQLITQLTLTRYDELVEQWLDGTLQTKWIELEGKELTKKQKVEERQIRGIAMIFRQPDDSHIRQTIRQKNWRILEFYLCDGKITLEVKS